MALQTDKSHSNPIIRIIIYRNLKLKGAGDPLGRSFSLVFSSFSSTTQLGNILMNLYGQSSPPDPSLRPLPRLHMQPSPSVLILASVSSFIILSNQFHHTDHFLFSTQSSCGTAYIQPSWLCKGPSEKLPLRTYHLPFLSLTHLLYQTSCLPSCLLSRLFPKPP